VDFSHYSDSSVQMGVDLVNTDDVVAGDDKLTSPDVLEQFLMDHEAACGVLDHRPDARDLAEVKDLRHHLREVFETDATATAAERINTILADSGAIPYVSVHGAGAHLHVEPRGAGIAQRLGAICAMGLGVALIEGGLERFGICDSSTCDDVFVDTSRNRSRRYCSDTCTTRQNVAAFRRRQRSSAAS